MLKNNNNKLSAVFITATPLSTRFIFTNQNKKKINEKYSNNNLLL